MKSLKPFPYPRSRLLRPEELFSVYQTLYQAFGHQNWWPGETPFEMIVGAILTQNTNWKNVEKALMNLKRSGSLSPHELHRLPEKQLAELIRPSGYFNIKAARLKHFIQFLFTDYGGQLDRMFEEDGDALRKKLLGVTGIGPETADSILLYAAKKPFFVIDAYTKRIFSRHRLKKNEAPYEEWRELFQESLSPDLYNDFHAQIVMLGKEYCKATLARCEACPLAVYL